MRGTRTLDGGGEGNAGIEPHERSIVSDGKSRQVDVDSW
jgi:hypothetical protein